MATSASPSLRESKKEQTRLSIARAAVRLFLKRGFEQVSIAEIAEAAQVSKMTVFNYFPAKEDMFFEFTHGRLPDLARVLAGRRAPIIAAMRRFVRSEFAATAEWTGLHPGAAEFTRLIFSSPTLIEGFNRQWRELEQGLVEAFADAAGLERTPSSIAGRLASAFESPAGSDIDANAAGALTSEYVRVRVAVAQVLAVIQSLVSVNQLRQAAGTPTADAVAAALRECDDAFDLLENGLGEFRLGD